MFKLVGRELFEINNVKCAITIEAVGIFAYEYSLQVGGKSYEKFRDQQTKALIVWLVTVGNLVPSSAEPSDEELHDTRICLGWISVIQCVIIYAFPVHRLIVARIRCHLTIRNHSYLLPGKRRQL